MITMNEYVRYEITVENGEQILHCYQSKDFYSGDTFDGEIHYIDSFGSTNYMEWLSQGNQAPTPTVIDPPAAEPKYPPIPSGITPKDWREIMYKRYSDSHLIASISYEKEGNAVKAAEKLALVAAEKAAIRSAYPDE